MRGSAEDVAAVQAAVRCVYLTRGWTTRPGTFSSALRKQACPRSEAARARWNLGECILFCDGLRFDVGQRLAAMARRCGLEVRRVWRWAALPTVTATAKPAVVPGRQRACAASAWRRTSVRRLPNGDRTDDRSLPKLLSAEGFQVLGAAESGNPRDKNARGWTEYGELDKLGHDLQAKLAARIDDQLELLLERIQGLLEAGWKRVRVVTDHGWLLLPGGMPKVQLPKYLAESRWSRCASIKDSSHVEVPVAAWSWNPQERFAYAPGVHCFVAGQEYAHGGVSLQECLVPVLTVVSTEAPVHRGRHRERDPMGRSALPSRGRAGEPRAGCRPADEAQRRRLQCDGPQGAGRRRQGLTAGSR